MIRPVVWLGFILSGLIRSAKAQVPTPRIVGGFIAYPDEFPYFILWGGCAATLIHNDIALGAAHCSGGANKVAVGASQRDGNDDSVVTTVEKRVNHPDFNASDYFYDFSVIKLGGWIQKDVVKLSSRTPDINETMTISGFGQTSEGGQNSDILLTGQVNYFDDGQCASIYNSVNTLNSSAMLCALGSGIDACYGDSGSPILDMFGNQVGLSSFGIGCAREGVPGVYARVSAAIEWINNQVCELSQSPPAVCQYSSNTPSSSDFPLVETPVGDPGGGTGSNSNGGPGSGPSGGGPGDDSGGGGPNGESPGDSDLDGGPGVGSGNNPTIEDFKETARVDMYYDIYPGDNTWTITSIGGEVIGKSNNVTEENVLISTILKMEIGDYYFQLDDSYGDGFEGEGRYEVYQMSTFGDELLVSGGGISVGSGTRTIFSIFETYTPAPTVAANPTPSPGRPVPNCPALESPRQLFDWISCRLCQVVNQC